MSASPPVHEILSMFVLKKYLASIFSPLSLSMGLMAVGVLLLWFTRKQRTGRLLVALGLIFLLLCSYEGVSGRVLRTLESQYPPLDLSRILVEHHEGISAHSVKWIVVLAGGVFGDTSLPYQLQISHHSRIRLVEGVRLHRMLPRSKIILTGGIGFDGPPAATTLSRVAEELGVKRSNMLLEVESRDTKDHPLYVRDIVENDKFILVTSAFHMPRAMQLFSKQGLFPIPAPAGHWTPPRRFWSTENLFPSSRGLLLAERAYHEYLGLVWAWIRGQI